jgi:hypothetical protein
LLIATRERTQKRYATQKERTFLPSKIYYLSTGAGTTLAALFFVFKMTLKIKDHKAALRVEFLEGLSVARAAGFQHLPAPSSTFETVAASLEAVNAWCHAQAAAPSTPPPSQAALQQLEPHAALVYRYLREHSDAIMSAYDYFTGMHMLMVFYELAHCTSPGAPTLAPDCVAHQYHAMAQQVVCADMARAVCRARSAAGAAGVAGGGSATRWRWDPARAAAPHVQHIAHVLCST